MGYNKKIGYSVTPTGYKALYSSSIPYYGQSFYNKTLCTLAEASVMLKYIGDGSQTGNIYAKIYAHSGTFGSSSVPSGSALATSDAIDASTLTSSGVLTRFTFSAENQIALSRNNYYCVVVYYTGTNATNHIGVGYDDTTLSDDGNAFSSADGSSWTEEASEDCYFFVYGEDSDLHVRVTELEDAIDRIRYPLPGTVTITLSGITNCGEDATGNSTAESFNGTWELPSAGGVTFQLIDGDKILQVAISDTSGYVHCYVYDSPSSWTVFDATGTANIRRGDTVLSTKTTCSGTSDSEGSGGQCFIH